jgi:thiol-disulfide isomerase/thioredoxin
MACIASSGMLAKRPPHIFWPPDEEEVLDTDTRSAPARRNWPLWGAMAMLAFAGVAILYVLFAAGSKPAETAGMTRFAVGAMRSLTVMDDPPPMPMRAIQDDQGRVTNLHAFAGQVLVVNMWATWCAPCMEEMPTLGALQRRFAGRIRVIPVNVDDTAHLQQAKQELQRLTQGSLPLYNDNSRGVLFDVNTPGMPVTLIYDRHGREVARLAGGADWSSDAAAHVIEAVLAENAT